MALSIGCSREVTGATPGIGFVVARGFVAAGAQVGFGDMGLATALGVAGQPGPAANLERVIA
jgi:NAD(P)-dependent dehydrogenase (short-subunit alcohol dehydrogenase family)